MSKLVRDKIPDIINAEEGRTAVIRIASDVEREGLLVSKLYEEIEEFLDSVTPASQIEELADVAEVLRAIAFITGSSPSEIEQYRSIKFGERGGFNHGVVLIKTVGP